ncbi:thioredoxin family protein [Kitasatospora sp. NPDC101157]|uniref:thioredoxin family protein n=1 Tax=Kitasatospora sp. NPDC101157 TaxID=3364098 RepID=UPI0038036970
MKSPGAIQAVTDSSFEQDVIKSNKPVVVEFWAAWCGPCRQSEANLSAIAAAHGDKVEVVRLDIDRSQATPARYGVTALPVLDVFKDGKVVKTITGAEPKAALEHDLAPFVGQ